MRKRETSEFNEQRRRWVFDQARSLVKNIRYLPSAIFNQHYDWVDKILQWMLLPRSIMLIIIVIMSITLPFIYFTLAVKWWIVTIVWGFSLAIATPDELVDGHWDRDFITLPLTTAMNGFKKLLSVIRRK
jgi:hypothetical protein